MVSIPLESFTLRNGGEGSAQYARGPKVKATHTYACALTSRTLAFGKLSTGAPGRGEISESVQAGAPTLLESCPCCLAIFSHDEIDWEL